MVLFKRNYKKNMPNFLAWIRHILKKIKLIFVDTFKKVWNFCFPNCYIVSLFFRFMGLNSVRKLVKKFIKNEDFYNKNDDVVSNNNNTLKWNFVKFLEKESLEFEYKKLSLEKWELWCVRNSKLYEFKKKYLFFEYCDKTNNKNKEDKNKGNLKKTISKVNENVVVKGFVTNQVYLLKFLNLDEIKKWNINVLIPSVKQLKNKFIKYSNLEVKGVKEDVDNINLVVNKKKLINEKLIDQLASLKFKKVLEKERVESVNFFKEHIGEMSKTYRTKSIFTVEDLHKFGVDNMNYKKSYSTIPFVQYFLDFKKVVDVYLYPEFLNETETILNEGKKIQYNSVIRFRPKTWEHLNVLEFKRYVITDDIQSLDSSLRTDVDTLNLSKKDVFSGKVEVFPVSVGRVNSNNIYRRFSIKKFIQKKILSKFWASILRDKIIHFEHLTFKEPLIFFEKKNKKNKNKFILQKRTNFVTILFIPVWFIENNEKVFGRKFLKKNNLAYQNNWWLQLKERELFWNHWFLKKLPFSTLRKVWVFLLKLVLFQYYDSDRKVLVNIDPYHSMYEIHGMEGYKEHHAWLKKFFASYFDTYNKISTITVGMFILEDLDFWKKYLLDYWFHEWESLVQKNHPELYKKMFMFFDAERVKYYKSNMNLHVDVDNEEQTLVADIGPDEVEWEIEDDEYFFFYDTFIYKFWYGEVGNSLDQEVWFGDSNFYFQLDPAPGDFAKSMGIKLDPTIPIEVIDSYIPDDVIENVINEYDNYLDKAIFRAHFSDWYPGVFLDEEEELDIYSRWQMASPSLSGNVEYPYHFDAFYELNRPIMEQDFYEEGEGEAIRTRWMTRPWSMRASMRTLMYYLSKFHNKCKSIQYTFLTYKLDYYKKYLKSQVRYKLFQHNVIRLWRLKRLYNYSKIYELRIFQFFKKVANKSCENWYQSKNDWYGYSVFNFFRWLDQYIRYFFGKYTYYLNWKYNNFFSAEDFYIKFVSLPGNSPIGKLYSDFVDLEDEVNYVYHSGREKFVCIYKKKSSWGIRFLKGYFSFLQLELERFKDWPWWKKGFWYYFYKFFYILIGGLFYFLNKYFNKLCELNFYIKNNIWGFYIYPILCSLIWNRYKQSFHDIVYFSKKYFFNLISTHFFYEFFYLFYYKWIPSISWPGFGNILLRLFGIGEEYDWQFTFYWWCALPWVAKIESIQLYFSKVIKIWKITWKQFFITWLYYDIIIWPWILLPFWVYFLKPWWEQFGRKIIWNYFLKNVIICLQILLCCFQFFLLIIKDIYIWWMDGYYEIINLGYTLRARRTIKFSLLFIPYFCFWLFVVLLPTNETYRAWLIWFSRNYENVNEIEFHIFPTIIIALTFYWWFKDFFIERIDSSYNRRLNQKRFHDIITFRDRLDKKLGSKNPDNYYDYFDYPVIQTGGYQTGATAFSGSKEISFQSFVDTWQNFIYHFWFDGYQGTIEHPSYLITYQHFLKFNIIGFDDRDGKKTWQVKKNKAISLMFDSFISYEKYLFGDPYIVDDYFWRPHFVNYWSLDSLDKLKKFEWSFNIRSSILYINKEKCLENLDAHFYAQNLSDDRTLFYNFNGDTGFMVEDFWDVNFIPQGVPLEPFEFNKIYDLDISSEFYGMFSECADTIYHYESNVWEILSDLDHDFWHSNYYRLFNLSHKNEYRSHLIPRFYPGLGLYDAFFLAKNSYYTKRYFNFLNYSKSFFFLNEWLIYDFVPTTEEFGIDPLIGYDISAWGYLFWQDYMVYMWGDHDFIVYHSGWWIHANSYYNKLIALRLCRVLAYKHGLKVESFLPEMLMLTNYMDVTWDHPYTTFDVAPPIAEYLKRNNVDFWDTVYTQSDRRVYYWLDWKITLWTDWYFDLLEQLQEWGEKFL